MHKSDLIELISVLSDVEKNRLSKFLAAADPDVKPDVSRFINYVMECIQSHNSSGLSRQTAYQFLFQDQPWVENKLEKLMSESLATVRRFVVQEVSNRQLTELRQAFYLQVFYNERGLEDKYHATNRQINRTRLKRQNWRTEDYYTNFLSEKEETYFQSVRNRRKDDVNLKNAMFALQEYFLVEHLWFCCYILNHQQMPRLICLLFRM